MRGVEIDSVHPVAPMIPETVFVMFQLTFAIITPALIIGGFAERMRFSSMLWFSILWLVIVYIPVAHWVWARRVARSGASATSRAAPSCT